MICFRPGDYVLATNETHSVREFVEKAFQHIGVEIEWKGKGVNEVSRAASIIWASREKHKVALKRDWALRWFTMFEMFEMFGDRL